MILNIKYICEEYIIINGLYKLKTYNLQRIDDEMYRSITSKETMACFRALGGEEKATRRKTKFGNKIIRLESLSPDKKTKILRLFNFNEALEEV
jgi:hypothetical protein